jgi:hypothetical protein
VLKDFVIRATFLYNELGQFIIQSRGPTMVPNEVEQQSTQIPEIVRRGAPSRNRKRAHAEVGNQHPTMEAKEVEPQKTVKMKRRNPLKNHKA